MAWHHYSSRYLSSAQRIRIRHGFRMNLETSRLRLQRWRAASSQGRRVLNRQHFSASLRLCLAGRSGLQLMFVNLRLRK